MATDRRLAPVLFALMLAPALGQAQGRPMSAIDWLSDTVARPPATVTMRPEPPIRPLGEPDKIVTSTLSSRNLDAIGVLPLEVTELDPRFWAGSMVPRLRELLMAEGPEPLPALRELLQTLLLARLQAPLDADGGGAFLLLRIDRLLQDGALEAAHSLVEAARPLTVDLFRRSFDIALLMVTEDKACAEQRATPRIAPTVSARIFCLARGGDWTAAELTLNTSRALGRVSAEDDALLSRFLAPEDYEDAEPLPPPARMTPLVLRIYEAIGEPISSTSLPVAFAHGDLSPATGWKARLEAAERLARVGAITPGQLFAVYAERRPAASGTVWTRVAAVQRLDAALTRGDARAVAEELPQVWEQMVGQELEVPFAAMYAGSLQRLALAPEARRLADHLALLSPRAETFARSYRPTDPRDVFLRGLALGQLDGQPPADRMAHAIAPVFVEAASLPELPLTYRELIAGERRGEAALLAMQRVMQGAQGDLRQVTEGLLVLRHLGLDSTVRRTALQLMLLERRG